MQMSKNHSFRSFAYKVLTWDHGSLRNPTRDFLEDRIKSNSLVFPHWLNYDEYGLPRDKKGKHPQQIRILFHFMFFLLLCLPVCKHVSNHLENYATVKAFVTDILSRKWEILFQNDLSEKQG